MTVLICEDNITGVYSGIYEAWAGKYDREQLEIKIDGQYDYELFKEYIKVEPDEENAKKVINTLRKRFGGEFLNTVTLALWSDSVDKADIVYKTVKYGIEMKCRGNYLSNYTVDYILRLNKIYKNIYNELHHYYGFVRFSELENGCLFSRIRPKNYCLEAISEHFADRLPSENWIIYDVGRKIASVHKSRERWFIVRDAQIDEGLITDNLSENEESYRKLWIKFFDAISIKERENSNLQRNNLPLRFREFLVENIKTVQPPY